MGAPRILPPYEAHRMIGDVVRRGVSDAEPEAWAEAEAAIDEAVQPPSPVSLGDLAAQILIDTRMGANGLSPAILQRLKGIADTA